MRKGELSINQVILWIIAVIVLLVVLFFYTGLGEKIDSLLEALLGLIRG